MSEDAQTFKTNGNEAFKARDFDKAVEYFKKAIELTPSDHTLYGNTSAAYFNSNNFDEALLYADECIKVNPDWSKGYQRRGMALASLDRKDAAKEAFQKGLELDPSNTQITSALQNLEKPAEEDGFFNAESMAKLMADPETRVMFDDLDFKNKFEFCKNNPQMMMQLMQTDPRFMTVFKVATGIDLGMMQQNQFGNQQNMEERKQKYEEDQKKREAAEEERRKKEEEDQLPNEEKEKLEQKHKAEEEKDLGNKAYKAKNFEEAISHYDRAIELSPDDLTYYTNKAAVFFEMKEYDKCIEL